MLCLTRLAQPTAPTATPHQLAQNVTVGVNVTGIVEPATYYCKPWCPVVPHAMRGQQPASLRARGTAGPPDLISFSGSHRVHHVPAQRGVRQRGTDGPKPELHLLGWQQAACVGANACWPGMCLAIAAPQPKRPRRLHGAQNAAVPRRTAGQAA